MSVSVGIDISARSVNVVIRRGDTASKTKIFKQSAGENEPYGINTHNDYTIPEHGEGRQLPYAGIEIRQDLLLSPPRPNKPGPGGLRGCCRGR